MKITYDKIADAMYFYIKKGVIDNTICVNQYINVDVDKNGETIGIELLYVSSKQGSELKKNIKNGVPIEVLSGTTVLV